MEAKDVNEIKGEILAKLREQEENVKGIEYIEEMQLLENKNEYYGLSENDIFLVKKAEQKNNKKVIIYDIYDKETQLIGKADEKGKVELSEEYKEKLQEKYKSLYKKLGIDKRPIKIKDIDKYIEDEQLEQEETTDEKSEEIIENKEDKQEEVENPNQMPENEQVEKMEESLGLDAKDIKSSSEITDPQFYQMVPEAKEYKGNVSVVYVGSTNEFMIVGVDKQTGEYKPLETVEASRATEVGETNKTIDLGNDGSEVQAKSLKAIINIKGENEYSFATKLEGMNPIEFKGLRRDQHSGEYISWDIDTSHQYPSTQKVADMMDKDKNTFVTEEVEKYNAQTDKGEEITSIEKIEDDKLKVNSGDKQKEQEKQEAEQKTNQRAPGGRTPYDDWAEKHGLQ